MTKPLYTISEAVNSYGISRSRLYLLMADGTLTARKLGKRTMITADSLQQLVDNLPVAKFGSAKAA